MKLLKWNIMLVMIFLACVLLFTSLSFAWDNGFQEEQGQPIKTMAANDPRRQIAEEILGSAKYSMKKMFSNEEWISERYGDAWERAKEYYDNEGMVFNPKTDQLIGHSFTHDGKLLMDVYNSPLFNSMMKNWGLYTKKNVLIRSHYGNDAGLKKKLGPAFSLRELGLKK